MPTCSGCSLKFITMSELWAHLHLDDKLPYDEIALRNAFHSPATYATCPAAKSRAAKIKTLEATRRPLRGPRAPPSEETKQCRTLPFAGGMSLGNLHEKIKFMLLENNAFHETLAHEALPRKSALGADVEFEKKKTQKVITKERPPPTTRPPPPRNAAAAIARAEGQTKRLMKEDWALVPGMPNAIYVRI